MIDYRNNELDKKIRSFAILVARDRRDNILELTDDVKIACEFNDDIDIVSITLRVDNIEKRCLYLDLAVPARAAILIGHIKNHINYYNNSLVA